MADTIVLFRPVGARERDLIAESGEVIAEFRCDRSPDGRSAKER